MKKPATKKTEEYIPSDDEKYMNKKQLAYFRQKLLDWKDELLKEQQEILEELKEEGDTSQQVEDEVDRANDEIAKGVELKSKNRESKLIKKIDEALERVEDGSYGYCMMTGDPIGLKRLMARPTATMTLEAQEEHERQERLHKKI